MPKAYHLPGYHLPFQLEQKYSYGNAKRGLVGVFPNFDINS